MARHGRHRLYCEYCDVRCQQGGPLETWQLERGRGVSGGIAEMGAGERWKGRGEN